MIHTRLSTWVAVGSIVLTAFTAFPSWPSLWAHVFNVLILYAVIVLARQEGKAIKQEHLDELIRTVKNGVGDHD